MRGFIALASRADVYTTSASASNVSVYTNTICVAKRLLGTPKPLNCTVPVQARCSRKPHPSFSHSAFNAAAVSESMPSFRQRAGYQRAELSLCALERGVGACRLHSDGRSRRCGRNCLRRLLYGARLWPRYRNVITRYNTFTSVICKVQWTLRSLSEGASPAGKLRLKNWINCK